jgi:hypothetical protein
MEGASLSLGHEISLEKIVRGAEWQGKNRETGGNSRIEAARVHLRAEGREKQTHRRGCRQLALLPSSVRELSRCVDMQATQ